MNINSLFLCLIYSLPSPTHTPKPAFPMVFLHFCICLRQISRCFITDFFFFSFQHHIHTISKSAWFYLQNILRTWPPLTTSCHRLCSPGSWFWDGAKQAERLRECAPGIRAAGREGDELSRGRSWTGIRSQWKACADSTSWDGLSWGERPGLYTPHQPVTACRLPWEGEMPWGKMALFREGNIGGGLTAKSH